MEKKELLEWREHLIKMFGIYHSDEMRHTDCPLCGVNLEKLSDFMIEELDKAREEGIKEGVNSVLYPKFKREKNGTIKREGWVDTSKLKTKEDEK
jgi:hypothetical protein